MPEDEPLPVATPRPTVTPLPRVGEERTARDIAAVRPGPTRTPAPRGTGISPRPAPQPGATPAPPAGIASREVDITILNLGVGTVVETSTQREIGRTEFAGDTYAVSAYAGWPSHYRISSVPASRMTATVKAQIRGGDSQRPIVGLILSIDPNDPQAPGSVFFGKDERRVIIDYKHGQNWQKLLDIWVPSDAAALDEFTLHKDNEVIRFVLNGRELATWNAPTGMPMSAWLWTWEDTVGGFRDWSVRKIEETRAPTSSPAPAGKTWLGMSLESVAGSAYGLRVTGLTPGSPTERAGLRPGDFLIDIDERRIDNFAVLEGIIAGAEPGRPLNVTIVREGRVYLVQVMPEVP